jgi:hypothetical protein
MSKLTSFLLSIATLTLLLTPVANAAEVSGKIGYMSGSLIAKRADGSVKIMAPKSEVIAGDILETSKDSFAQVLMNDGAQMTLRPNSTLKIEAFRFNKEAPKDDNAVFRLLKGGFRTASGLVGKRGNRDAFQLRAKTATIGIRGTDFTTRLCAEQDQNCEEVNVTLPQTATPAATPTTESRTDTEPGVYVTVHNGQIILSQENGKTIDINKGQTGFVNDTVITQLPATPKFMSSDKQADSRDSGTATSSKSTTAPTQSGCVVK